MWTRLVAGAAAHDINNLTQGLSNLLAIASKPGVTPETLAHCRLMGEARLEELRHLSARLHALARSQHQTRPQPIDLICADALAEADVPAGRTLEADVLPAGGMVRGTADGIRTALAGLLRYALAASAKGTAVRLGLALGQADVVVTIDAPGAPAPAAPPEHRAGLAAVFGTPFGDDVRGDLGMVLAGAIVAGSEGALLAGAGPVGGLRFAIHFPRVEEEGAEDGRGGQ
jgi:hypothetical protein